jgi:pimeloyl-ACP methyl ester carboxylesterase
MRPETNGGTELPARAILKVAGGHLAYETAGQGPPILFLHSVIADSRMWDREFQSYSADHQTIRFDLRGFGGSSPASTAFSYGEDIKALLTHLRVPRPYLVGSSMGGAFAIDFALENPEMVRGLLLAAPGLSGGLEPPFRPEETAAFEYDDTKSQEVARAWSKGDAPAAFELLRQLWCSALEGPSLELFRRMVDENSTEVLDNRSMQLATSPPPAAGRLGTIHAPTTILVGDRDNPSSECFAKRIAGSIPGAHLATVAGADHLINLSRPAAFDAALRAALHREG